MRALALALVAGCAANPPWETEDVGLCDWLAAEGPCEGEGSVQVACLTALLK